VVREHALRELFAALGLGGEPTTHRIVDHQDGEQPLSERPHHPLRNVFVEGVVDLSASLTFSEALASSG